MDFFPIAIFFSHTRRELEFGRNVQAQMQKQMIHIKSHPNNFDHERQVETDFSRGLEWCEMG